MYSLLKGMTFFNKKSGLRKFIEIVELQYSPLLIMGNPLLANSRQLTMLNKRVQRMPRRRSKASFLPGASSNYCTAAEHCLHIPVMADEVLEYFKPHGKQVYLDFTFGAGGHSKKILESSPEVKLVCLDRDPSAYGYAKELQASYPNRVLPLLGKFRFVKL